MSCRAVWVALVPIVLNIEVSYALPAPEWTDENLAAVAPVETPQIEPTPDPGAGAMCGGYEDADTRQVCDENSDTTTCEAETGQFEREDDKRITPPETIDELKAIWEKTHPRCNLFARFDKMLPEAKCMLLGGTPIPDTDDSTKIGCYCPTVDNVSKPVLKAIKIDASKEYCDGVTVRTYTKDDIERIIGPRILAYLKELERVEGQDVPIKSPSPVPITVKRYDLDSLALFILGYPSGQFEYFDGFEKPVPGYVCKQQAFSALQCLAPLGINVDKDGIHFGCTGGVGHIIPVLRTLSRDYEPQICLFDPSHRRKIFLCLEAKEGESVADWLKRHRDEILDALRQEYSSWFTCNFNLKKYLLEATDIERIARIGACCNCLDKSAEKSVIFYPQYGDSDPYGVNITCERACELYGKSKNGQAWTALTWEDRDGVVRNRFMCSADSPVVQLKQ